MFNSDIPTIPENFNLCKCLSLSLSLSLSPPYILLIPNSDGSHPFYLEVRNGGLSHGVFLRNSDPMDVILSDNSLQYRVIGGELTWCREYARTPRPSCFAT